MPDGRSVNEVNGMERSVKVKVNLRNVHETLLLPLWGRAEEAKMKDPVLKDRAAAELVGRIDYDFSKFHSQLKQFQILALAIRAREFDSMIRDFIQRHPRATIVNIGAGLDTTYNRVDNGKIRWYDLDVPQVIRLRSELMSCGCEETVIPKSMFDESFFDDIREPQDGILFLVGGVLMYFEEEKVREFFSMIGRRYPGCEIVFDSIAPAGIRIASRMVKKAGIDGAEMKWGVRRASELEGWHIGLKLLESYPLGYKTKIYPSWGMFSGTLMRLNNVLSWINMNHMKLEPEETESRLGTL
jgi:O-methyltransferase involved in polyketide biosynthesis